MKSLYHIDSSGRKTGSSSRKLASELIEKLNANQEYKISYRDVSEGLHFLNEEFISAMYTPEGKRTQAQRDLLNLSDTLVDEIKNADIIVMGVPMYNFSVPASLKAWSDLVARAGMTFKYSEKGPEGLLKNKKVYLVVASGGVAIGSAQDFLTPWLKFFLGFLGINDVSLISADGMAIDADSSFAKARDQIRLLAA